MFSAVFGCFTSKKHPILEPNISLNFTIYKSFIVIKTMSLPPSRSNSTNDGKQPQSDDKETGDNTNNKSDALSPPNKIVMSSKSCRKKDKPYASSKSATSLVIRGVFFTFPISTSRINDPSDLDSDNKNNVDEDSYKCWSWKSVQHSHKYENW